MPRLKNRPKIKKGSERLSDEQLQYLLTGDCLEHVGTNLTAVVTQIGSQTFRDYIPFRDMAEFKRAWEKNRDYIMSLIGKDDGFPAGIRPDAWWIFDSKEPRRQLSGAKPCRDNRLYRGEPEMWESMEDAYAAVFETEYEYLKRLDLLLTGEEEMINTEEEND